ncbi:response regulator transcription factor [Streptomyces sp. NPDC127074]|uniref:response regulator transcription factor n=1 Tax=Streptomyces sp. NPDC127074 TaxID=3347130 RepID=UPI003667FAC1
MLMLTAAGSLRDRLSGFAIGAEDHLPKSFEFPGLVVRLRVLERRTQPAGPPLLESQGVRLDPFRREVCRDGRPVRLTPKEFAVPQALVRAEGRGVERGAGTRAGVGRERRRVHELAAALLRARARTGHRTRRPRLTPNRDGGLTTHLDLSRAKAEI